MSVAGLLCLVALAAVFLLLWGYWEGLDTPREGGER